MVWEMTHEDYGKADGTQGGVPMKRLSTEA